MKHWCAFSVDILYSILLCFCEIIQTFTRKKSAQPTWGRAESGSGRQSASARPARSESCKKTPNVRYHIYNIYNIYNIYHIKHDPPCQDDPQHSFHSHRFDIIRTPATGHTPAKLIGWRRNYGLEISRIYLSFHKSVGSLVYKRIENVENGWKVGGLHVYWKHFL